MTITCLCLKYGTAYGPEYVNRLWAGLRRHAGGPVRLFCVTDASAGIDPEVHVLPLPEEPFAQRMEAALETAPKRGRLKKISLFRPGLVPGHSGPVLILDLDVVILGPLADLWTFAPGKIAMRREWRGSSRAPSLGHGSVERIDPEKHRYLYDRMAAAPEDAVAFGGGSEQTYTSRSAAEAGDLAFFPDDWVASFKYDCRPPRPLNLLLEPRRPPRARVLCFHGRPKMEEAVAGYRAGLSSTRPCRWLAREWMGAAA